MASGKKFWPQDKGAEDSSFFSSFYQVQKRTVASLFIFSFLEAKEGERRGPQISGGKPEFGALIMKWILGIAMTAFGEGIAKFGLLVSEMFKPGENEIPSSDLPDILEENVRSSMLLSVVVLLIVVVTRSQGI